MANIDIFGTLHNVTGEALTKANEIEDIAQANSELAKLMGSTGNFDLNAINEALAETVDPITLQLLETLLEAAETAENEESAPVAFNSNFANFIISAIKADIIENVIEISTNVTSTCTITGAANNGHCQTIIYRNITETVENPDYDENDPTSEQYLSEETDLYVSVPSNFVTPGGTQIVLLCPIGGYCEVSYLNVNGTIYARGL